VIDGESGVFGYEEVMGGLNPDRGQLVMWVFDEDRQEEVGRSVSNIF